MIGKASTFLGPNGLYRVSGATPSLVLSLDTTSSLSLGIATEIWYDLSIRKNNGFNNNFGIDGIGSTPTSVVTSLVYDGSTSYTSFTQSNGIPLGNSPYTIEAWINSDSYDYSEQGSIIGWGTTGVDNAVNVLRLDGSGLTNYWWNNDHNTSFNGTSSMIVGNWYYVVASYDGVNRKIYLNGELKSADTPTGTHSVTDNSNLEIGHFYNSYFNGKISKVKISDKSLSDSKILSSFNADKVLYGYEFGSMTFNDSSSYLISSSNDYILGTNDFTIEAFFKAATSSHNYSGIISQRQVGNFNVSINMQSANTSEPLIEFCSGSMWMTYTASNNNWYHVAISRTSGTSSYYVNGSLFAEVADTTNYGVADFVIGRYYTEYDDYYFNGIISNTRVVNGTGLYTGNSIRIPKTQLASITNTKFLINSQKTTPSADISGLLHTVTASNIGWTASLPIFDDLNYPNFASTDGLVLVGTDGISTNWIYLTTTGMSKNGNVYSDKAIRYDRNFSFEFQFECSGGYGADGFCVQWTTTNNSNGGVGGDVSVIANSSTINALKFQTWSNNTLQWLHNNSLVTSSPFGGFSIRQNVYYWMDYNYGTSTMDIYYSTSSTKPGSPQKTFTSFTFDSGLYYIGFGAATGGSDDNHILKSMKLTF
jgi:hypothetical protein